MIISSHHRNQLHFKTIKIENVIVKLFYYYINNSIHILLYFWSSKCSFVKRLKKKKNIKKKISPT